MSSPASPVKFGLVSHVIPPSGSGQSVVLSRLLRDVPPSCYCLLSRRVPTSAAASPDVLPALPAPTTTLPPPPSGLSPLVAAPLRVRHLLLQARTTARVARAQGCEALVACTGELWDIPATYLASRWLGVPFHAYLFDDYVEQWEPRGKRAFARAAEALAVRGAAGVIVPNEFLGEVYRRRHGVEPTIVRNPFDPAHRHVEELGERRVGDGLRVVFTGTVYNAHFDAFRRLVAALDQLPGARLHVYTQQDAAVFGREGIAGPMTVHPQVPPAEVARVQRQADVLFLPLAFSSPAPEVVRTAAPGKLGEYLLVGRSVLAHAPADSFVAHWFRSRRCGLLVDRPEVPALASALRRLAEDRALVAELQANARACAPEFSVEAARGAFFELLRRGGARGQT